MSIHVPAAPPLSIADQPPTAPPLATIRHTRPLPRRRYTLAALMAQCDPDAPPPADLAAWDAAPRVGSEVL